MACIYSTCRLGAVASITFLAIENMPTVQLRTVEAMRGGRLSWQSYRIIATRLVIFSLIYSWHYLPLPVSNANTCCMECGWCQFDKLSYIMKDTLMTCQLFFYLDWLSFC